MIARMTTEQMSQFRERRADNARERRANNRANGTTFGAAICNADGMFPGGIPTEDYLGSLSFRCTGCNALHFADERTVSHTNIFSDFCQNRKLGDRFRHLAYPERMSIY